MKRLALVAALLAFSTPALAGEDYIGVIISAAGADTTNASTATPFKVALGSKLTMYCTAAVNICTDTTSTCTVLGGAKPGLPWAATTNFPTSTSGSGKVLDTSGTAANGASILRIVGAGAVTCYVWKREGNE